MAESARTIWSRKLEHFRRQEAITASPEQKFELREKIAEVQAKLRELDDEDAGVPVPQAPANPRRTPTTPKPDRTGSPFLVGQPIEHDEDLFGRQSQRDFLRTAVETGQSVQLLGERRMGKTSLLKWIGRHAPTWQERPVVWVNAQGLAGRSPAALVRAVAEGLGRQEEAEKLRDDDNAAVVMKGLLPAVLLLDEAAVLARDGHGFDADFLGVLREFCEERRLVWISASVVELMQLFQDTGLASDFLNNAREVQVGQLEDDAALALASRLGDAAAAALVRTQADGFAYGIQWLGDRLWRRPGDPEAACDAFADAMEKHFRRWWDGRGDADRALLKRCVVEMARAGLDGAGRRQALRLERLGFLVERAGSFVVPGAAWREFVRDV